MAVEIDVSGYTNRSAGTDTTADHALTVAANSNRVLLAIGYTDTSDVSMTGVAYQAGSGGAFAKAGEQYFTTGPNSRGIEFWVSVAPSTGSVTVRGTWGAALGTDGSLIVYSLYNVDQATPYSGFASTKFSATSLAVTSMSNGRIIWCSDNASSGSPTGGTTDLTLSGTNAEVITLNTAGDGSAKTLNFGGVALAVAGLNFIEASAAAGRSMLIGHSGILINGGRTFEGLIR